MACHNVITRSGRSSSVGGGRTTEDPNDEQDPTDDRSGVGGSHGLGGRPPPQPRLGGAGRGGPHGGGQPQPGRHHAPRPRRAHRGRPRPRHPRHRGRHLHLGEAVQQARRLRPLLPVRLRQGDRRHRRHLPPPAQRQGHRPAAGARRQGLRLRPVQNDRREGDPLPRQDRPAHRRRRHRVHPGAASTSAAPSPTSAT